MSEKVAKKKGCQSYTIQDKAHIIQYAFCTSNIKAATKFSLDKSQVGHWVVQLKDQLNEIKHSKLCHFEGAGRKCFFSKEEARLYSWISDMCSAALAVTYNSLRLEMLKFVSEAASKSNDLTKIQLASTFKASLMWIKHFLKCYNLALYRKTKISQKMPADFE
ncbi:12691_t:CDS:1 [Dentiscutata erythropus]|uniref:12691_t:CDS:1 n=1 Tax=Dentiscutata erythropus TaxID=1348616 RepID=A0A9N9JMF1_9GLOM|nr:12691_t:CDS:1 [Dentiscutata erythropus]